MLRIQMKQNIIFLINNRKDAGDIKYWYKLQEELQKEFVKILK